MIFFPMKLGIGFDHFGVRFVTLRNTLMLLNNKESVKL